MLNKSDKTLLIKASLTDDVRYQIGKNGLTDTTISMFLKALEARELLKINVMKNCTFSIEELCIELANTLKCNIVEKKGNSILIFKKRKSDSRFKNIND